MVYMDHAIHFYSWKICEKIDPGFMAINVNHAANSTLNYHWERKQACEFRKKKKKQTVSWENPMLADWRWHLHLLTQNVEAEPKKGGQHQQEKKMSLRLQRLNCFT